MPSFRYEAVAASGELVIGEMEAATRDDMVLHLQRLGHVPIRAEAEGARRRSRFSRPLLLLPRARRNSDLVRMTQQIAVLLEAGLTIDRALEIAASTNPGGTEAQALVAALERVRGGASLADAMAADPASFPRFYVGMVRAGEAGATLDTTLRDLGTLLERNAASREQVKSALIYPALVLATCVASIALLFLFVIPRFRPIFDQAGSTLPPIAAAVFAIADFTRDWWWAALLGMAIATLAISRALRRPGGRARWGRAILVLPLVGDIVIRIETGRFAGTLGTLLQNGVAPVTALAITRESIGNGTIAEALAALSDRLKEGKGWAGPIAEARLFPPLAVQLIRVGEETARLESMLKKIGEIYADETRRSIDRLLALLVPGITILLGLIVAVAIGSIFSAILSVYEFAL
ncbi:MAG TPA: type II secretion system F family protein [Stellaceae bacterium]|nr:type II secretion system F family protein [Stellaceae bacterium]